MLDSVDPFAEGMKACLSKRARESSPFPERSRDWQVWLDGWDYCARALEDRRPALLRRFEVRAIDADGDLWTFASDDQVRADQRLARMREDLGGVELIVHE